jgi:hypothetical protein
MGIYRGGIIDKTKMYEAASRRFGMIELYGYCIPSWHLGTLDNDQVGLLNGNDLR